MTWCLSHLFGVADSERRDALCASRSHSARTRSAAMLLAREFVRRFVALSERRDALGDREDHATPSKSEA